MIKTYSLTGGTPFPVEQHEAEALYAGASGETPVWIDLVDPTPEECDNIGNRFGIPPEHLHAALDFNERPRIEFADTILLVVARTPYRDSAAPYGRTCPIAVIGTPAAIVTICLKSGIASGLLCRKLLGSGTKLAERLVLSLLLRISTTFIEELQEMDRMVDNMELALDKSMQNQELLKMLHLEKALIYFLTALKGNQSMLDKIKAGALLADSSEGKALLDDVFIETKQATDMAEIFTQIMGTISDAFGAIVSNNLNKVMKVLTGLTIVFMVPSIIGALYGMNVPLPFSESRFAFAALCIACFVISFLVYRVLKKMDWM